LLSRRFASEEGLDWGWKRVVHPGDADHLTDYWRSVLASGEPGEFEARLRRFDGEYRWFLFRFSPLRDESRNIVKWYGTNSDIEDRKHATEALRRSERNFRLIVDSIPALVSTMTASGDAELVNRQVMDYTGKTIEETARRQQSAVFSRSSGCIVGSQSFSRNRESLRCRGAYPALTAFPASSVPILRPVKSNSSTKRCWIIRASGWRN